MATREEISVAKQKMDDAYSALQNYSERPANRDVDTFLHLQLAEALRVAINQYVALLTETIQSS